MNIITRQYRALLLTAAVMCLSGCGEDSWDWLGLGDSGGNNNCTSSERCKSKEMPDGKVWMTENLSIKTADSWCYDDKAVNCTKYGRLYTWNAATTACPSGWHLPNTLEWPTLEAYAGGWKVAGKKLKSKSGWDGAKRFGGMTGRMGARAE